MQESGTHENSTCTPWSPDFLRRRGGTRKPWEPRRKWGGTWPTSRCRCLVRTRDTAGGWSWRRRSTMTGWRPCRLRTPVLSGYSYRSCYKTLECYFQRYNIMKKYNWQFFFLRHAATFLKCFNTLIKSNVLITNNYFLWFLKVKEIYSVYTKILWILFYFNYNTKLKSVPVLFNWYIV